MNTRDISLINQEINVQLKDPKVGAALLATTFKGLEANTMKQAIMEGMIRGFKFVDFLDKNVYAIPFANGYSLVTSVDYSRKRGMRSGIVGKKAPMYELGSDGKVESCTVTVQRMVSNYVGDFTATVYFSEYYKKGKEYNGKYTPSMWDLKPRTMIAKVAEMQALRMACPEELSQVYIEEEFNDEDVSTPSRFTVAKGESTGLKMGNLKKNGQETAGEENQTPEGVSDAESSQEQEDKEPVIKD